MNLDLRNLKAKIQYFDLLLELYETLKIAILHKNDLETILVYQMGKVGSSTIYATLKSLKGPKQIYHIHYLTERVISRAFKCNDLGKRKRIPLHLTTSRSLRKKIDFNSDKIKIISLTREPVVRVISRFFQNIQYVSPELFLNNDELDCESLQNKINEFFKNFNIEYEDATTWFTREFNNALGVDIYSSPFDKERGYSIYNFNNIDVLIIKVERLADIGCEALNTLLKCDSISNLQNTNVGEKKRYAEDYVAIQKRIKLDKKTLETFYSTQYVNHFYTTNEIDNFKQRWME